MILGRLQGEDLRPRVDARRGSDGLAEGGSHPFRDTVGSRARGDLVLPEHVVRVETELEVVRVPRLLRDVPVQGDARGLEGDVPDLALLLRHEVELHGEVGAQVADVTVDTETGLVKINRMVAAQDCGLIIDMKTAESQVYGALIMGVTYSLFEEKVMDDQTGIMLNPNMEFYKLAGIGDIGELVVHMMTGPGYDERGVIGLGEPPVISPGAYILNAVTNAIGVRVPTIPVTPEKVLAALAKGGMA